MTATTPSKPASAQGTVAFQPRVQTWMMACFGAEISADVVERNHRFLEEALELVQSTGCTASEAHQLVDYVFGRNIGETHQEIGGVMVTLAALCLALGQDMHKAGEIELARIWTKVEKIRAKQAAKPKHSPLPQHVAAAPEPAASPPSPGEDPKEVCDLAWRMWCEDQPGIIWTAENKKAYRERARSTLASDATANSKAGDEDVRGAERFAGLMLGQDAAEVWKAQAVKLADELDAAEGALAKAVADEREVCAQIAYRVCAETRHVTLGYKAADAIRARTLATPETESRDGARNA